MICGPPQRPRERFESAVPSHWDRLRDCATSGSYLDCFGLLRAALGKVMRCQKSRVWCGLALSDYV